MHNVKAEVKFFHSAILICWKISIDYDAIDDTQHGKRPGVSVGELYGETWKK